MSAPADSYLDEVRRIVLARLAGYDVAVYLFGSRARGTGRRASDVDVAVEPVEPLPLGVLAELREALDESTVPYRVEIVDLSAADEAFCARVKREGVLWKGCESA